MPAVEQRVSAAEKKESHEKKVTIFKHINFILFTYLAYISVTCPCRPALYSCHLTQVYSALIVAIAIIIYFNKANFLSYTPVPNDD